MYLFMKNLKQNLILIWCLCSTINLVLAQTQRPITALNQNDLKKAVIPGVFSLYKVVEYLEVNQNEAAYKYLKERERSGIHWVYLMLGYMHREGLYVKQSDKDAIKFFHKALDDKSYFYYGLLMDLHISYLKRNSSLCTEIPNQPQYICEICSINKWKESSFHLIPDSKFEMKVYESILSNSEVDLEYILKNEVKCD